MSSGFSQNLIQRISVSQIQANAISFICVFQIQANAIQHKVSLTHGVAILHRMNKK